MTAFRLWWAHFCSNIRYFYNSSYARQRPCLTHDSWTNPNRPWPGAEYEQQTYTETKTEQQSKAQTPSWCWVFLREDSQLFWKRQDPGILLLCLWWKVRKLYSARDMFVCVCVFPMRSWSWYLCVHVRLDTNVLMCV